MRAWLTSLVRGRALELALALALGYATVKLAGDIVDTGLGALAQHIGRDPESGESGAGLGLLNLLSAPYSLNFSVGHTVIVYGKVVSSLLALGLVALAGLVVIRIRDREFGLCAFCASRIPNESTRCAICGSEIEPGTPGMGGEA